MPLFFFKKKKNKKQTKKKTTTGSRYKNWALGNIWKAWLSLNTRFHQLNGAFF
jgi:hypothetical protein